MASEPEAEDFNAKLALLGEMREMAMHSSPEAEAKQLLMPSVIPAPQP